MTGHEGNVFALAFHPDGRLLVSGGADMTVRLWDVQRREVLKVLSDHEGSVGSLAFSGDGRHLASVGRDGRLNVWSVQAAP